MAQDMGLPTHAELRELYPQHYSVISANLSQAAAWTFTMVARSRGWVVSDPEPNGSGTWFIEVWRQGDEDAKAQGRFREETKAEREARVAEERSPWFEELGWS